MKKVPKWMKPLTTKERKHIKEWCGGTLRTFKFGREDQRKQDAANPTAPMACRDCFLIAKKLGLE